jgi:hypothetical protein
MGGAWTTFRECGAGSWLVLLVSLFAMLGAGVAIVIAAMRARVAKAIAFVALAFALGPPAVGVLARAYAMQRVEAALSSGYVDASQAARIRVVGEEEANGCVSVGLVFGVLPIALAGAAVAMAFALKAREAG